jgi:hypothetical protein
MIAAPQVTVGVRVDRLFTVFKLISSPLALNAVTFTKAQKLLMDSHETFGNGDSKMIAFIVKNLEEYLPTIKTDLALTVDPSEEFKGYMVLIASYVFKASKKYNSGAYTSAKIIAPIMSRTCLNKPFTKLLGPEQVALAADNGTPFAKIIWYITTRQGGRNSYPWSKFQERFMYQGMSFDDVTPNPDPHGYIIPKGQVGNEKGDMPPNPGPKVLDFIKGLTTGNDLMKIQTMGKYNKFETVNGVDGYILEFRRMPSLPHTQWKDAFVAAFDFLSAINSADSATAAATVSDVTFGFLEQSNHVHASPVHASPVLVDQTVQGKSKLVARMNMKKA